MSAGVAIGAGLDDAWSPGFFRAASDARLVLLTPAG
jgi:hypothetical protein